MKSFMCTQPGDYFQGLVACVKFCGTLRTVCVILRTPTLPPPESSVCSVWGGVCALPFLLHDRLDDYADQTKSVLRQRDGQRTHRKTDRQTDRYALVCSSSADVNVKRLLKNREGGG